ncbi:MAG: NAD(P)H-quinone oxidoreductase subunit F [Cyanobacteria bacterium P01_C01_bin.89]
MDNFSTVADFTLVGFDTVLLNTVWLAPCYCLFGSIATLPWSTAMTRGQGPRLPAYLNLLATAIACIHGGIAFFATYSHEVRYIDWPWLRVGDLVLDFSLEISPVSVGAMELIALLVFLAQLYALGYLEKDWGMGRFFGLMGFFGFAMTGLVLSDSLLLSYALLEMLTLSTYLIVGFWYSQPLAPKAARDAFWTKRVGDILMLMGIIAVSSLAGTLNFVELEAWAATNPLPAWQATLLGLALLSGPLGKCAQFPLHLWLDEAMEGPNPASIMRNSVVVGCGAYVLVKMMPVIALSQTALDMAISLGTITAICASLVAIAQVDIKRAMSHGTSAYLGLVFVAVGFQQHDIALLLLLTHGIAKASIFISFGSVILTTNNQDLREMGGLARSMPATTFAYVSGALGLVGVLPFGTFWVMYRWICEPGLPLWTVGLALVINGLSAINVVRVYGLVFAGDRTLKTRRAPEMPWPMAVPMVSLGVLNLLVPLMMEQWQLALSSTLISAGSQALSELYLGMMMVSGVAGATIAGSLYFRKNRRPVTLPSQALQNLLSYDFYIDKIYEVTIAATVGLFSQLIAWVDRFVVDGAVNLVGLATLMGGEGLKYSTNGRSQAYVLVLLIGIGAMVLLASLSSLGF